MMKKKVAAIVLGIMFCAGLTAGCGQKQADQANVETTKQDNAVAGNSEEEKQEETAQENEVTGTIDDIKDFSLSSRMKMISHIALPLKKNRKVWKV